MTPRYIEFLESEVARDEIEKAKSGLQTTFVPNGVKESLALIRPVPIKVTDSVAALLRLMDAGGRDGSLAEKELEKLAAEHRMPASDFISKAQAKLSTHEAKRLASTEDPAEQLRRENVELRKINAALEERLARLEARFEKEVV